VDSINSNDKIRIDKLLDEVEQAKAPVDLDQRRYERTTTSSSASLLVKSGLFGKSIPVRVHNASPSGLGLELPKDVALPINEKVDVLWLVPPLLHQGSAPKPSRLRGTIVRLGTSSQHSFQCGVRFDGLLQEQLTHEEGRKSRILTAILAGLLAILICVLKSRNVISFWYQPLLQIYSLAAALYVLSRAGLAVLYREPKDAGYLAAISVVIAVKNEEKVIASTVKHCFEARYPQDLLEVLVVDDGSTDGTWKVLQELQAQYSNLKVFQFEQNKGKRHAMALGATKAKGAIVIFIDSDSLVEPEGFYRIIQPFASKRVGAVAGHTLVIIEEDNFISKMEAVRYYVSQRIMKAAEGVFGVVGCCPGPFSAYRRDAVMVALPAWLGQTFLGTAATFGDDRSLTNFILKTHDVVYHAGARCSTYVPRKWETFFRQQLRWKKSWIRETTIAARFMYTKHPFAVLAYYGSVVITVVSPLVAVRAILFLPLTGGGVSYAPYLLGLLLVYGFFGLLYYYFTREDHWYYGMAFALIYVAVLSFQNYYALVTVNRNHWGTR
jgi:hyaluronan synthase